MNSALTNISLKKDAAGQVYLVTARNFVAVYEAQYRVSVPEKVRRALALFIGEAEGSKTILDSTDISVDGEKVRGIAYDQNYRLVFEVIRNYDTKMATMLLDWLKMQIASVCELCFAAGAVKDRDKWANVLWYKNLVDADRVEIINPGTFPSNLTMAELRAGNKSEPRNPTIARVMYSRKTVETWGRGIKLMLDECAKANLPEPQIVAEGGYTKTVFMRPVSDSKGGVRTSDSDLSHGLDEVNREVNEVNEVNQCILQILRSTPQCTIPVMAQMAKVSRATIDRAIKTLKEQGRIRRVGRTRGHWEVIEE